MKRCPHCGETKPAEAFGWRSDRVGQLRPWCRACTNTLTRKWLREHPKKARENERRSRARNPERVRELHRLAATRRYARDPSGQRERTKRWLAKNPERSIIANWRRFTRKKNAAGRTTVDQFRARWAYYGGRCWICGQKATQMDHVIALARGGSNWPANLRPACGWCNGSKGARDWRAVATSRPSAVPSLMT